MVGHEGPNLPVEVHRVVTFLRKITGFYNPVKFCTDLFGVKSFFIHPEFASRHKIGALILIGRAGERALHDDRNLSNER